jgi:Mitochondrial inner membrane protein
MRFSLISGTRFLNFRFIFACRLSGSLENVISAIFNHALLLVDRRKGGFFWKILGLSFVGAGGVIGYAWYDSSFRKTVENNLPYSRSVFDYLSLYLPPSSGEEAILR